MAVGKSRAYEAYVVFQLNHIYLFIYYFFNRQHESPYIIEECPKAITENRGTRPHIP